MRHPPIRARRRRGITEIVLRGGKPRGASLATALAAAATLALGSAGVAAADTCYTRAGCTQTARGAADFTASVGVNTHLGYSQSVYWQNWPVVRDRLLELGVSHIRDGSFPASYPDVIGPVVAARYNDLGANGIKGNLLVGHEQAMTPTTVAQRLSWIADNVANFTMSVEGSNEFDTYGGDPERIRSLRAMQCEIQARVAADVERRSNDSGGCATGCATSRSGIARGESPT